MYRDTMFTIIVYPEMHRDTVFTIVIYLDMYHDTTSFVVSSRFSPFSVPAVARALPWCCLVFRHKCLSRCLISRFTVESVQ